MYGALDNNGSGIKWGLYNRLEDIDYADDICFQSHMWKGTLGKLNNLARETRNAGQSACKTKSMRVSFSNDEKFTIDDQPMEDIQEFIYLSSEICRVESTESKVICHIKKARHAFRTNYYKPMFNLI